MTLLERLQSAQEALPELEELLALAILKLDREPERARQLVLRTARGCGSLAELLDVDAPPPP